MKITTKTVHTLHLQREQVDKNIRACVSDILNDLSKASLEDYNSELHYISKVVNWAVNGEYAKICQEGFTMYLLDSEEAELVDNHFFNKRRGVKDELTLEIYDEEVFIDRIKETQIDF